MSDGPHRSLPLPSRWRRFMQVLENEYYDSQEAESIFEDGLLKDFRELPEKFIKLIRLLPNHENNLFGLGVEFDHLERIKYEYKGYPLMDLICSSFDHGLSCIDALVSGLTQFSLRQERSIVEHIILLGDDRQQHDVPLRVRQVITNFDFHRFASSLLLSNPTIEFVTKKKRLGLDDGPPL